MCGIVGIYSHEPVAQSLYDSLIHLQHRGQDAAGILTCNNKFFTKQGLGLVREIFNSEDLDSLQGNIGIAHTRYPTAGGYGQSDIQPLWIGSPRGIALAHNGNLVNYQAIADRIRYDQHRHLNSSLDSEVLLHLLADSLAKHSHTEHDDASFFDNLCRATRTIFQEVKGSYSVVTIVIGKGLVAFRDPHGIRPLAYGVRENADGTQDYIFASETTPFYALGFVPQGDLQPGEVAYVSTRGKLMRRVIEPKAFRPCVFEYVYFARPDATLDGVNVYRSRIRMGENLAKTWQRRFPDCLPDVVIPAPFTANTAALAFAQTLGVRYSEGLYKNPFIGRTFIMPNQKTRARHVRYKLTPQQIEIQNKNVLIVDDSIVRGTTSREIVKMVKEAGAKAIYFASSSPPIKNPCFYGIDIPTQKNLIAANDDEEGVRTFLGVDLLLYQTQEDLVEAVTRRGEHHIVKPCMACMDGQYICGNVDAEKAALSEATRQAEQKK
ncbi:MAG: amidophosphoribosyltransferase [Gammaproteobacteria bacterium]|nr:amidophosphoribosyltransferase [Gammaproteobacteria bacterium]